MDYFAHHTAEHTADMHTAAVIATAATVIVLATAVTWYAVRKQS